MSSSAPRTPPPTRAMQEAEALRAMAEAEAETPAPWTPEGPPPSPPREAARAEPDKKPERGGDYLIQIFQPPEKRVKKVEQEWKCIEDVTNPWLKKAFLTMYGSGGPPSPDVD
eukprot:9467383-Pyramimonas_sp.AAC.1